MNKSDLEKRKHDLYFVGSARGVNRVYIINKIMEEKPNLKVINTGSLIKNLLTKFSFGNLDDVPILKFHQFVEPMISEIILNHLEHTDVLLDTHYHYLLPGVSAKELIKFRNKVNNVFLILISEDPQKIKDSNSDAWFLDARNILDDLLLNRYHFNFYKSIFSDFTNTKDILICDSIINGEELKNFLKI